MSEKETGGAAFPSTNNVRCGEFVTGGHEGMTLRDYFAAKTLPAVYAEFWRGVASGDYGVGGDDWPTGVAMDAYRMADSMLKAREA